MLEAFEPWPVNVLFLARGNTVSHAALWEQLRGGAAGFKVHEDWGATPAAIDAALTVADQSGVQVAIHSDTLNEAGFVEDLLAAVKGRTFHAFHTEGAGGGHAPDIIRIASEPYVLPASTNPTRPFTVNTVAEHLDMVMVAHHLNPQVPNDLAFAESRVRAGTIAAEDVLQDMGALSIMSSDAQAMGRIGEVVTRTWQTAHRMKQLRGVVARRRPQRQPSGSPLRRQVHDLPGRRARPRARGRVDRARQDGRLRVVAAGAVRCPPNGGVQGRHGRDRLPRRSERLHSHPAAGPATARLQRPQPSSRQHQCRLRLRGGHRGRPGRPAANCAAGWCPSPTSAEGPRPTCRRTPPCRGSRSIPTATPSRIDGERIEHEPATEVPMAQRYFLF